MTLDSHTFSLFGDGEDLSSPVSVGVWKAGVDKGLPSVYKESFAPLEMMQAWNSMLQDSNDAHVYVPMHIYPKYCIHANLQPVVDLSKDLPDLLDHLLLLGPSTLRYNYKEYNCKSA